MTLRDFSKYLALLILSAAIFLPVMRVSTSKTWDFGGHVRKALDLPETVTHVTHVLFHGAYRFVAAVAPEDTAWSRSALIAILFFMLPLPLILFWLLKRAAAGSMPDWLIGALALGLTILSPITIGVETNKYMTGFINSNVYHNPTLLALRPFIAPLSLLALRIFEGRGYKNANQRLCILLLTLALGMAAMQAKPSYTIVLLPGCCLTALYWRLRGKSVDWALLIAGFCLPGLALLALQYLLSYVNYQDGSRIAFGFLTYLRLQHDDWQILASLILSLVFPLGVCWLYGQAARNDLYLRMSWLVFAFSLAMGYGFYEAGPREEHGNLMWSSYAAMNALMFASLHFLLRQHDSESRRGIGGWQLFGWHISKRVGVGLLLFGLHMLSGIAYIVRFMQSW